MQIKASDVKKLREKTGAGMLDCKNALSKAEGDFEKAEKYLKEMGLAAAAKRSGRTTSEGRIFTKVTPEAAVILELNCETDFVARNNDFIATGEKLMDMVLENKLTEKTEELESVVKDTISKIKENITLSRFALMNVGENEFITDYVHGEGKIGVLVKTKVEDPALLENADVKQFSFDSALHIAAFNPLYLSKDHVEPKYLEEQEDIFRKQAEKLDKPENVLQGIIKGKLNKHLSEITFLDQPFVKDDKKSVSKVMSELSKNLGSKVDVVEYIYFGLGLGS